VSLPTLSVLLHNYNQGAHMEEALKAIFSQSLRPDEIIIIDDCSTDNSAEIIREILKEKPGIKFVQNDKNCGTCYTLNRIVHEATCDYFHLVGPDDLMLPGYYEKSLNILSQYPQAGLCSSITQCRDITGNNLNLNPSPPYLSNKALYLPPEKLTDVYKRYGSWYSGTSTIWRRKPYVELGGFAPAELESLTDLYKFFQLALKYGVCFIPEILHTWTVTSSGFSAKSRQDPNTTLKLHRLAEELMTNDSDDIFPSDFIEEFKKRGLISVTNIRIEKSHNEMLQALKYTENNRPEISGGDRLFVFLLKHMYKMQHFFTVIHFNFNLTRFLKKCKWNVLFRLKK
jgi:glycosyltransferase involved in cell wall biosynthesis